MSQVLLFARDCSRHCVYSNKEQKNMHTAYDFWVLLYQLKLNEHFPMSLNVLKITTFIDCIVFPYITCPGPNCWTFQLSIFYKWKLWYTFFFSGFPQLLPDWILKEALVGQKLMMQRAKLLFRKFSIIFVRPFPLPTA